MGLAGQVVDFCRFDRTDDAMYIGEFCHVTEMQFQSAVFALVGVQVLNSGPVVGTRRTHHSMHLITFGQQQFSQIGPILK